MSINKKYIRKCKCCGGTGKKVFPNHQLYVFYEKYGCAGYSGPKESKRTVEEICNEEDFHLESSGGAR
jgi:hypothetical protein